jgi:hypothetical protein
MMKTKSPEGKVDFKCMYAECVRGVAADVVCCEANEVSQTMGHKHSSEVNLGRDDGVMVLSWCYDGVTAVL